MKLADVHIKLESKHDAASAWVEAAKAFLKSDQRRELLLGRWVMSRVEVKGGGWVEDVTGALALVGNSVLGMGC